MVTWFRRVFAWLVAWVRRQFWREPAVVPAPVTVAFTPVVTVREAKAPAIPTPKTRLVVLVDEDRRNPRRVEIPIPKNSLRIKIDGLHFDRIAVRADGLCEYEPMRGQLRTVEMNGSTIH